MKNLIFIISLLFFINELSAQIIDKDSISTISFSVVGDLMCHSTQLRYAKIDSNSYDFNNVYKKIKDHLVSSDFTIGNLETTFAGEEKGFKGYPIFNTPDEYLDALKNTGFDLLFTANNHSFDMGKDGLIRTIKKINENGLLHSGTYESESDIDSILLIKKNNISFAVLSYSYSNNGVKIEKGNEILLSMIKRGKIKKDLKNAKDKNPDFIIVYFHFGKEYDLEPNDYQKEYVNYARKNGADIILASHTHSLQPIEMFNENNKNNLDSGFVAYSLGNFISNQRWRYSDAGVILNFSVTKNHNKNKVILSELNYIPTWVYKGNWRYTIYPSEIAENNNYPDFFTAEDSSNLKQSFYDAKSILNKYSNKPKLKSIYK